jgi:hypothetical protein
MTKFTPPFTLLATVLALGLHAAPAQAITRTFIASFGNDANPCTRPLPCRLLAAAYAVTDINGEIHALDPAGYGAVTITKSISIFNDGTGNAISQAPSSPPYTSITVNAANTDTITIRGFYFEGSYTMGSSTGIKFSSGGKLNILDCALHGFSNAAIDFTPAIGPNGADMLASNIIIQGAGTGINFAPTGSGFASITLNRAELSHALVGLKVDSSGVSSGAVAAHATDSIFRTNMTNVMAKTTSGVLALIRLVRSAVVFSDTGLTVDGSNAIIHLSESTVGPNNVAWTILNSGVVRGSGDNVIDNNLGGDPTPTPTIAKK